MRYISGSRRISSKLTTYRKMIVDGVVMEVFPDSSNRVDIRRILYMSRLAGVTIAPATFAEYKEFEQKNNR